MRFRRSTADRRLALRTAARALALVAVLAAAVLALDQAPAQAAPTVPPPPVADWPTPETCTMGPVADAKRRAYCEHKRVCGSDGPTGEWASWCEALREGEQLRRCLDGGAPGTLTADCGRQRDVLEGRCPFRPGAFLNSPDDWLCEQYFRTYAPDAPRRAEGPPAPGSPQAPPEYEQQDAQRSGAPDVFAALGARSPACNYPGRLDSTTRAWCEVSGSIAHGYPLAHYGLDSHVGVGRKLFLFTGFEVIASGLQAYANLVWTGTLYLLKAILLLLEWAFELPLVTDCNRSQQTDGACQSALPTIADALDDLHNNVLGTPWMLAALGFAGAAATWTGLVRMRFSESVGGLAATVALMSAGLAIIAYPGATIGELARITNDASIGILNGASIARGDNPSSSMADVQQGLFDTLVRRPWCALQFGDVEYCTRSAEGSPVQIADVWLAFRANSVEREALYKITKGEEVDNGWQSKATDVLNNVGTGALLGPLIGPIFSSLRGSSDARKWQAKDRAKAVEDEIRRIIGKEADPAKVSLQEADGTPTRMALLGTVVLTQLAAATVLGWLAIRLVGASVAMLVLLLLTPLVLLMAGLGQAGRNICLLCGRRLAETTGARFVLAFCLLVVVFISEVLARFQLGFFTGLLLQAAFWIGVILRRNQLLGLFRFDAAAASGQAGGGGGFNPMNAYWAGRAVLDVSRGLRDTVAAPVRAVRARNLGWREAQGHALRASVDRSLQGRARHALALRRQLDRRRAQMLQARRAGLEQQLARARQTRADLEHRLRGKEMEGASGQLRRLEDRRAALKAAQVGSAARRTANREDLRALTRQRARLVAVRQRAHEADRDTSRYDAMLGRLDDRIRAARSMLRDARDVEQATPRELFEVDATIARTKADQLTVDENGELRVTPGADSEAAARAADVAEIERLKREEHRLAQELQSPEIRWAEGFLTRDAAGDAISEDEVRRWLEDRRATIYGGGALDGDDQLIAAGIDPVAYRDADTEEREAMLRRSLEAIEHDRHLFDQRSSERIPNRELHDAAEEAAHTDPWFVDQAVRRHRELRQLRRDDRIRRRRM